MTARRGSRRLDHKLPGDRRLLSITWYVPRTGNSTTARQWLAHGTQIRLSTTQRPKLLILRTMASGKYPAERGSHDPVKQSHNALFASCCAANAARVGPHAHSMFLDGSDLNTAGHVGAAGVDPCTSMPLSLPLCLPLCLPSTNGGPGCPPSGTLHVPNAFEYDALCQVRPPRCNIYSTSDVAFMAAYSNAVSTALLSCKTTTTGGGQPAHSQEEEEEKEEKEEEQTEALVWNPPPLCTVWIDRMQRWTTEVDIMVEQALLCSQGCGGDVLVTCPSPRSVAAVNQGKCRYVSLSLSLSVSMFALN